jgi:hypothetical protein
MKGEGGKKKEEEEGRRTKVGWRAERKGANGPRE